MKKEIDLSDLCNYIDNLNLSEKKLLKLIRHIFFKLAVKIDKTEYDDMLRETESLIGILP